MKTDSQVQKDVIGQLKWEPFLNTSEIGVAVKNSILTLSGQVDSYSRKLPAENSARKIPGAKAIAEELKTGVSPAFEKTDTEIAEAVLNLLKWHSAIQEEKIKIKVENGSVRLEGEVEWEYQRNSARSAIENLRGVLSIINLITVKPKVTASYIQEKISSAFHRTASIDAGKITAEVKGSRVILRGNVRSFVEKDDAETAAWNAPGVTSVESNLEIAFPEFAF